jgi:hypothetical protein
MIPLLVVADLNSPRPMRQRTSARFGVIIRSATGERNHLAGSFGEAPA